MSSRHIIALLQFMALFLGFFSIKNLKLQVSKSPPCQFGQIDLDFLT